MDPTYFQSVQNVRKDFLILQKSKLTLKSVQISRPFLKCHVKKESQLGIQNINYEFTIEI
jgi:hypothetical protein